MVVPVLHRSWPLKHLKLVTTIRIAIGAMLAIALFAAGVMAWTAQRTHEITTRMNLAHQAYEGHLSLSANAYQLFKQYGDAMIIGDRDGGAGERELTLAVRGDIAGIRSIIAKEIELIGSEEAEKLAALAEIETKTNRLIEALETYRVGAREEDFRTNWSNISRILDGEIDLEFRRLIELARDQAAAEVRDARAGIARYVALNQILALAAAAATILAAFGSIVLFNRRIRWPVMRVIEGVGRFGAGDYQHRIAMPGSDELAQIAQALDGMADKISDRSQHAIGRQAELSQKVAERTAQLESMLDHAREQDRNRRTLLSDVSHELKTPLTIIRGEADIALRTATDDPTPLRMALERTRDAATHTARIVDDLLFISRSEEGKPRMAAEIVDLAKLLNTVTRTFAPDLPVKGAEQPASVNADPGRISQAILILYDNAKRHGGKAIAILLERTLEGYRVAVEDDGPGMTDEEKARAFERFYRGGSSSEASSSIGLGLGLPVARAIVEAHGGTIALADRPGGGLVASFTLPALARLRAVS